MTNQIPETAPEYLVGIFDTKHKYYTSLIVCKDTRPAIRQFQDFLSDSSHPFSSNPGDYEMRLLGELKFDNDGHAKWTQKGTLLLAGTGEGDMPEMERTSLEQQQFGDK